MNIQPKLIAIDIDGTLFNNHSEITPRTQEAIRTCIEKGVEIVISTGRPYAGLPVDILANLGVRYAITANGAAIYEIPSKTCLYENCMDWEIPYEILSQLEGKELHLDAFINGDGYSQTDCAKRLHRLDMPESNKKYIRATRTFTEHLASYIKEQKPNIQKMLINFYPLPDGSFGHRDEVEKLLSTYSEITFLCGGYHNFEFTKTGTTKGSGLLFLCKHLDISPAETMAIGDSENDLDIMNTAAIGVAMGNAHAEVKEIADYVTLSNEEDGVAHALEHFVLKR